ncbi:MAG: hypothetical protein RL155_438, partial [Actinomycetota bacterium]
ATIREIHHRVKNNLQTVSALLRLQSRRIEDPNASAAIEEAVRRVASIALVHETLSSSAQDTVQFDEVISKIIQSAVELSARPNEIKIEKEGEFGSIPSLVATPLALVLTELIHNALEHGVSDKGTSVRVKVVKTSSTLEKNTNLGLQIVSTLTQNELAGSIEFIKPAQGTEVRITFPLER